MNGAKNYNQPILSAQSQILQRQIIFFSVSDSGIERRKSQRGQLKYRSKNTRLTHALAHMNQCNFKKKIPKKLTFRKFSSPIYLINFVKRFSPAKSLGVYNERLKELHSANFICSKSIITKYLVNVFDRGNRKKFAAFIRVFLLRMD